MGRLHYYDDNVMVPVTPAYPQTVGGTALVESQSLPNVGFYGQVNATMPANRMNSWPFYVSQPIEITDYIFRIVTNGNATNTTVRCGIYYANPDYSSDGLVTEFTTTTVPAFTTGVFVTSVGTPYRLEVGQYYISTNQTALLTYRSPRAVALGVRQSTPNICFARLDSTVTATNPLPSTWPTTFDTGGWATDAQTWGPTALLYWNNL